MENNSNGYPCPQLPNCEYEKRLNELAKLWKVYEELQAKAAGRIDVPEVEQMEELRKKIDHLGGNLVATAEACVLKKHLDPQLAQCFHSLPSSSSGPKI